MPRRYVLQDVLLDSIKERLAELEELMEMASSHWTYEDPLYRFYHGSFKVYHLQEITEQIVHVLQELAPEDCEFHSFFKEIVNEGTGIVFEYSHNKEWTKYTRPILEAFFHAKFFLEMVIQYGKRLNKAPGSYPSGWAALLSLYGLR